MRREHLEGPRPPPDAGPPVDAQQPVRQREPTYGANCPVRTVVVMETGLPASGRRRRCPPREHGIPVVTRRLATVTFPGAAHGSDRCCSRASRARGKTAAGRGGWRPSLDLPLVRLQCYEGIGRQPRRSTDWDFPRQILHLRALEEPPVAAPDVEGRPRRACYDERFPARPNRCWAAAPAEPGGAARRRGGTGPTTSSRPFLLEVPVGPTRSASPEARHRGGRDGPPFVVLTSNRTRGCTTPLEAAAASTHWIDHPGPRAGRCRS